MNNADDNRDLIWTVCTSHMQPAARPRSGLPSRAERAAAQQQQHNNPTVVTGSNSSIVKALQRARQGGQLKLQGRGLTSLPDEIWDIATVELPDNTNWWETRETLETIDASQNEITTLPDYFSNKLDMLRELNLAHNALTALPPAQSWSNLAALVNLSLAHNQLRGLPEHFGHANLPPLVRLSAEHNLLQSLPSSLGMCSDLVELDLSHNQLPGLPSGLHGLVSLKKLQLSKNRISELPADFLGQPPPLLELDLSENRLQVMTLAIPTLQTILLGNNSLQALDLAGCDALQELSAPYNAFATLPSGLASLPSLATIDLSNNRIVRLDELVHCAGLTRLDVSCNEISFVPPLMGNLPLHRFALAANPLRTLPNAIREAPTPKLLAHLRGKIVDAAPQWEGDTRANHGVAGGEKPGARPASRDGRRPDQGRSLITGVENEPPPFTTLPFEALPFDQATRPPSYFDRGPPPPPTAAAAARHDRHDCHPPPPPPEPQEDSPYLTTAQLMSRQQQAHREQQQRMMMVAQQQQQQLMRAQQHAQQQHAQQQEQQHTEQPASGRIGRGARGAASGRAGFNALYNRPLSGRADRTHRGAEVGPARGECGQGSAGAARAGGAGGGDSSHDYQAEARAAADYNLRAMQAAKQRREAIEPADDRYESSAVRGQQPTPVDVSDAAEGAHGAAYGAAYGAMGGSRSSSSHTAAEVPPSAHADSKGSGTSSNDLIRFVMKEGTDLCVSALQLTELPARGYPETLTRIDASDNKLRRVPAALARLVPSLRALDVSKNGLSELPADLGECAELETIRASHNGLRGLPFIPTPLLRLTELQCDKNGLSDVPPYLWVCPRLKHVSLCANRLDLASLAMPGMPGGVGGGGGHAAPLEHLDLGENRLGAMPPLRLYPRLREVHVQQNGIRELPVPEIAQLQQLQTLDISMNDVSSLPPDLARLPLLQNLTIVGNPIRSIPQSVQQRGATAVIDLLRKRLPEAG